jgi:hypothetical protein
MSAGNTVATLTATPGLLVNRTYKITVKANAENASGVEMGTDYTMVTGFTTVTPASPIVQNESGSAQEANYCVMQFPNPTASGTHGTAITFYGRLYESGATPSGGNNPALVAQFGYAPANPDGSAISNPEYETAWNWFDAAYNSSCNGCGNNDEYMYTLTLPAAGTYNFTYRFSVDSGASWTYADDNGTGSNTGLTPFDFEKLAVLTVN